MIGKGGAACSTRPAPLPCVSCSWTSPLPIIPTSPTLTQQPTTQQPTTQQPTSQQPTTQPIIPPCPTALGPTSGKLCAPSCTAASDCNPQRSCSTCHYQETKWHGR